MQTALRKMGNSAGIILPKPLLVALGIEVGRQMDVSIEEGRIVATPVKRPAREGWEDAAAEIGALPLTEDEKAWLDFDDEIGEDWVW